MRAPKKASWEHFSHEADIGIRGTGSTLAEAFEMAGRALTAVVTDPALIQPKNEIAIFCQESDVELLFVDWINALVFEMDTRQMLFSDFQVTIDKGLLNAKIFGEPIDRLRHQPTVEIKGATLTELKVREQNDLWIAQCVVDV